jgi:hypothetical protein
MARVLRSVDNTRRVVASLGIAGPAVRLADERLSRPAPLVREAAAGVSRALGAGASRRPRRTSDYLTRG